MKKPTDGDRFEAWVQGKPDGYRGALLLSRGVYARHEGTFDEVLEFAKGVYVPGGKPVMVHAYRGVHQSHIVNYQGQEISVSLLVTQAGAGAPFELYRHVDRQTAEAALADARKRGALIALVVDGPDDLATAGGPFLVRLYAHLTKNPEFKKFADLGTAKKRVWEALEAEVSKLSVLSSRAMPPRAIPSNAPAAATTIAADAPRILRDAERRKRRRDDQRRRRLRQHQ